MLDELFRSKGRKGKNDFDDTPLELSRDNPLASLDWSKHKDAILTKLNFAAGVVFDDDIEPITKIDPSVVLEEYQGIQSLYDIPGLNIDHVIEYFQVKTLNHNLKIRKRLRRL